MAGIYFGAGGVKKIKNIYFGADGVKKIKKAWIGVNGVPKLFYSSELVLYENGTEPTTEISGTSGTTENATYLKSNGATAFIYLDIGKIDISEYTKMYFTGYTSGNSGSISELILNSDANDYKTFKTTSTKHTTTSSTICFDISGYTEQYLTWLRFSAAGRYSSNGTWQRSSVASYVTRIWLE